jgi:NSS family neurotransmitter:Na+ symporter
MVVSAGVQKGIERAALLLMPLLFLILIGLAIWVSGLDGTGPGYVYYLAPAWSDLLDPGVVADAAGQTYFSMSLGMGASLTFASYMRDDANLMKEGTIIAFSDFSVAFTAGLVVFPVVFALGFSDQVIGLGASEAEGVLFIALPGAFATMGFAGRILGLVFFSALSVAALTSTISLLEVVVSSVIDEWRVPRRTAAVGAGGLVVLLGLAPSFSLSVLSLMNTVAGEMALALGAFLTVIAVGWFVQNPDEELRKGGNATTRGLAPGWLAVVRFVLPVVTGAVLAFMIWGVVVGG